MRKTFIGGVAALAVAAVAGAVSAQTPAPAAQPRVHALRGDADHDGRISRAEFVDGRLARLTAADANGDGSVTREEMQTAFRARSAERADKRFARLDADGNGAISRAEFDAPRAERARGPRPEYAGRRGGRHAPMRAVHRGPRGPEGARERGPVVIADVRARLDEQFGKLDADADGFVTAEERRAATQAHRQARRERFEARRTQQPASPAPASE